MEQQIRSRKNVRDHGEVFTPMHIVDKMLDLLPDHCWTDPEYCFLEPACGTGNFLVRIFERRVAAGIPPDQALNSMIGLDISSENIKDCHDRLCNLSSEQYRHIVEHNIFVVVDSLEFMREGGVQTHEFLELI